MSMNTVPERLAALRAAMQANGCAAYLIPTGDPMPASTCRPLQFGLFLRLYWENSTLVVTRTASALWADGRFFVQAEKSWPEPRSSCRRWASPACPLWSSIAPMHWPRASAWACAA